MENWAYSLALCLTHICKLRSVYCCGCEQKINQIKVSTLLGSTNTSPCAPLPKHEHATDEDRTELHGYTGRKLPWKTSRFQARILREVIGLSVACMSQEKKGGRRHSVNVSHFKCGSGSIRNGGGRDGRISRVPFRPSFRRVPFCHL